MSPIFPFEGRLPSIDPTAFVAPTAAVIGDVELGPDSSVWYHCVLRGDTHPIRVGARSNIQDGTIVHVAAGTLPALIGDDVTIGHACIIHACTLKNHAFVGMGATVLDGAVIEEGGMLGAGGLLSPGKRIGPNELWLGAPARFVRVMSAEERAKWDRNAVHYAELGKRHRTSLAGRALPG
ncbi:gamma carbonic anhydrase family protein [Roseomonas marmotae]|uniref:Gamma carbonic anhydrase family protein n=1 Tax=Roseomonas marmotae TaxID=2768161 RepID=A0ABS3KAT5_9PROT|nr:gamma carbonic anhydrase family protein [Roseomonas marmotae]MBO1073758.1 gamma carbonic anhydrase family protein [Roseomonas marmotae]QTI78610.1 gamma carbonic anhydrase family protein [Roseomonas marmotae]